MQKDIFDVFVIFLVLREQLFHLAGSHAEINGIPWRQSDRSFKCGSDRRKGSIDIDPHEEGTPPLPLSYSRYLCLLHSKGPEFIYLEKAFYCSLLHYRFYYDTHVRPELTLDRSSFPVAGRIHSKNTEVSISFE